MECFAVLNRRFFFTAATGDRVNTGCIPRETGAVVEEKIHSKPCKSLCESAQGRLLFAEQIILANELNLPIVVHDREAHQDTINILKEHNKTSDVVFHCFSGSVEMMRECVKNGWYIALGGVVTFKNAKKMKDVAKEIPLEFLLLETDSPYLTPVPFRGKENQPAYTKYVAEEIAKIKNISLEEVIQATTLNAERIFKI